MHMQTATNPTTTKSAFETRTATPKKTEKGDAAVRAGRTTQAAILTAIASAIGIGFYVWFGFTGVALFALTLPVTLLLLWQSADVVRNDER
jgi:hypothetical protein